MVIYRKYRPQRFSEIVGQETIKKTLLSQLEKGKISHAYLLCGPAGTGKTSIARIFAKAVNCVKHDENKFGEPCNDCEVCNSVTAGTFLDLIEIDAASNRGIDEIRELREKIKLSPSRGRFKVYIIDEAHMLTPEAFNAFLKTLEEPPAHAVFILATTEPNKIPETILSRTTRFDFKLPSVDEIKEKLLKIVENEGWKLSLDSIEEIAKNANGAFRNGEVLLEKVAAADPSADLEKTRNILGRKDLKDCVYLLDLLFNGESRQAIIWLDNYLKNGGNVRVLAESILETLRKILLIQADAKTAAGVLDAEQERVLESLSKAVTAKQVLEMIDRFNKVLDDLRDAFIPALPFEIAIVSATIEKYNPENNNIEVVDSIDEGESATDVSQDKFTDPKKAETQPSNLVEESVVEIEAKQTDRKNNEEKLILKKLQDSWADILKAARAVSTSLELFLRSAKPIDIDDDLVILEFGFQFYKEKIEERKYKEMVEKILENALGVSLRIKAVQGKRKSIEPKREKPAVLPVKQSEVDAPDIFGKLE